MNTQQEMMRILQATNAYYKSPTINGWQPGVASDAVFATHNATGRVFTFTLDPESKVIKAESYSFVKSGSITIYTGTTNLGGRLIAPDMILALHTLFNFDFASNATFVVENNQARKIIQKEKKSRSRAASDATPPAKRFSGVSYRRNSGLLSVSSSRKISKVLRFFIYFESPFRR